MSNQTDQKSGVAAPAKKTAGERAFEIFCASIFLGMIGLVFYNAFLRYCFRSSFPPSEEWARFLFTYITYFGGVEAFYRRKHIAVDMFTNMMHGATRKCVDLIATALCIVAMVILVWGGWLNLEQVYDQYAVATGVNLALVDVSLFIMAAVGLALMVWDFFKMIRRPASEFNPKK